MPRSSISSNQINFSLHSVDSKSKQYFFEQFIPSLKNKGNGSSTPLQTNTIPSSSELTKISSEIDHLLKVTQERIRDFQEQSNKLQTWLKNKLNENSSGSNSSRDEKYAKYYSSSRSKLKEESKIKSEYKSSKNYLLFIIKKKKNIECFTDIFIVILD